MRRPAIFSWSIVVVLSLGLGCTTMQPTNPFAWLGGGKKTEKATAAREKPKENNPFKKDPAKKDEKPASDAAKTETAVASADKSAEKAPDAAKPAATTKPDADKKPAVITHDAETLAIIESELKDFPPEERTKFAQDLKALDPAMVKSLLHSMKLMRQMGQYAPSRVAQASLENSGNVASQGVTAAAVDGRANSADAGRGSGGLGTVQPWSNQVAMAGAPGLPGAVIDPTTSNLQAAGADGRNMARSFNPATGLGGLSTTEPRLGNIQPSPGVSVDPNAFNSTTINGQSPQPATQYSGQLPPNAANGTTSPLPNGAASSFPGSAASLPGANSAANAAPGMNVAQGTAGLNSASPAVPNIQVTGIYPVYAAQASAANPPLNSQTVVPASAQSIVPAGAAAPAGQWKDDLDRLIAATEASLGSTTPGTTDAEKQAYVERQVYLRMLYLMAGQQQRALEAIRDIGSADQEFWQQVFWALANYFDNDVMPDAADRSAQTVAQLRAAVQRLEETARLELRNVCFCHKISSFGNYERFQRDEFSPRQEVLVYGEVNNFKSEPTPDGQYRTLLRSTIEIFKAGPGGELVTSLPFDPTPDLCFNHRRDYFHSYVVTIPANMALGPYVLKLRVADELSGKMAEYSLKFTVK